MDGEALRSLLNGLDVAMLMRAALDEAAIALALGELAVGAVIALDGAVVARGHPRRIHDRNPVAHAETQALASGGPAFWDHPGRAVLVTTLEPCPMCLGAAVMAGIRHIVYGLADPGVCSGDAVRDNRYIRHHILTYRGGVLADESLALLRRSDPAMTAKIMAPEARPWLRAEP